MNRPLKKDTVLRTEASVTIAHIQRAVAAFYGFKVVDLTSERRDRDLVLARHIAMFLANRMTSKSTVAIGKYFGGRDHTTVIHAVRKIDRLKNTNVIISRTLADLSRILPTMTASEDFPPIEDLEEGAHAAATAMVLRAKNTGGYGVRGPAIEVRDKLCELFGEVVQGHGVIEDGLKLELLLSATGSWTVLEIDQKKSIARIVKHGKNWIRSSQAIPEKPIGEETNP